MTAAQLISGLLFILCMIAGPSGYAQNPERDAQVRDFLNQVKQMSPATRDSAFTAYIHDFTGMEAATAFALTGAALQYGQLEPVAGWKQCVMYVEGLIPLDTAILAEALIQTAKALHTLGHIGEAKSFYQRVITLLPPGQVSEDLAIAHNDLGIILQEQKDAPGSLAQFAQAKDIYADLLGENHFYVGKILNEIGKAYDQMGDYPRQIKAQEEAKRIFLLTVGRQHPMTALVSLNLALAYSAMHNPDAAASALEEALSIREALRDSSGVIVVLASMTEFKASFPEIYSAEDVQAAQEEVISRGVAYFDSNHVSLVGSYTNYARILLDNGQAAQGLFYAQKALRIRFHPSSGGGAAYALPLVAEMTRPDFHDVQLLGILARGYDMLYNTQQDTSHLHHALRTYEKGDSLIEVLKNELLLGASRRALIEEAHTFYVSATRSAMSWYHTASAQDPGNAQRQAMQRVFTYMEKSRNWELIQQYILSQRIRSVRNNDILGRINDLKSTLPELQATGNTAAVDSINKLIDVLVEQLRATFPDYYQYLYAPQTAQLEDIMVLCARQRVQWLHYIDLGEGKFSTLLITKDTVAMRPAEGASDSITFHKSALHRSIAEQDWSFAAHAYALYQLLLAPHARNLKPGLLYISTGGVHDDIPYDILLKASPENLPPEDLATQYILQDFAISCIPSGTFGLLTWRDDPRIQNSVFIAPSYASATLQYGGEEAREGKELLDGTLIGGTPDQEVVLAWLREADLFHFAGHTITDPGDIDSIYLLIGDGHDTLYLRELLNSPSSAMLAVLSSCQSTRGKLHAQSNINLAYGLAFAGTPHSISSRWSATDRETSKLFHAFYALFSNGTNSVESLRRARLTYLKDSPLAARHPRYWANWISHGHPVAFRNGQNKWRLLWIPAFMLVLIAIVRFRKASG